MFFSKNNILIIKLGIDNSAQRYKSVKDIELDIK